MNPKESMRSPTTGKRFRKTEFHPIAVSGDMVLTTLVCGFDCLEKMI